MEKVLGDFENNEDLNKTAKDLAVATSDETAIEKLQREIKEAENKTVPVEPIVNFLTKECEQDADLNKLIMLPHKTLEKCFSYVEKKARERIKGSSGWIADDEVYSWAIEYYKLDDAAIEKAEAEKRQKEKEERIKREAEAKKNKPAETPQKPKEKDEGQLSLFDFGGIDEA